MVNSTHDTYYKNSWNAKSVNYSKYDATDQDVLKTIYDPCPTGYHVPPGNAFTGFTNEDVKSTNSSKLNAYGSYDRGWLFYTDETKTETKTIAFPSIGYRQATTSNLSGYNTKGAYWTAIRFDTFYALFMDFNSKNVRPWGNNNFTASSAFSIRPTREKIKKDDEE